MKLNYDFFMKLALNEAKKAYEIGDVPIGCVIVHNNKVIGKGFNQRNKMKNTLYHAEIVAINEACNSILDWRLENCHMFVTVEPCAMCSGAILQARVETLVFGTQNAKAGCCGSIINILQNDKFNHKVQVVSGVLQQECSLLMKNFFKDLRNS